MRIQYFSGVQYGDNYYATIIEHIPSQYLPFTSYRPGDTYQYPESKLRLFTGDLEALKSQQ